MATATIEITLPGLTGFSLTLDLYPLASDTAAASGITLTEATNRKCTYTGTTTAGLSGVHLAIAKEGSTIRGEGYVTMSDTASVHVVGAPQSGDSYARLGAPAGASVSADIAAVLTAVQANGGGSGARSVSITVNDGTTVLTSAKVRVTQGSESYVVSTNGSGVAAFNLDDATWTVRVTKPGYTLAAQTLVVDGAETVTYSMTAVSVSTPSAPNLSVGTLLCLGTDGQEEAGVAIHFMLLEGPGTTGYAVDAAEWTETSDDDGEIEAEFIIGATYQARRGTIGKAVEFTVANGASFQLPEVLGAS